MHTVAVDIAIQEDLAKALASHFHTVVPFHNLLTIWFSYGQIVLRSAFRVFGVSLSLFLLMYSQVILSLDEKPALSYYQRTILIGGACNTHLHHSILKEQRNFLRLLKESNLHTFWAGLTTTNVTNIHCKQA